MLWKGHSSDYDVADIKREGSSSDYAVTEIRREIPFFSFGFARVSEVRHINYISSNIMIKFLLFLFRQLLYNVLQNISESYTMHIEQLILDTSNG